MAPIKMLIRKVWACKFATRCDKRIRAETGLLENYIGCNEKVPDQTI